MVQSRSMMVDHGSIIGLSLDTTMVNNGKFLITVDNIEMLNRVLNRMPSSVLKYDFFGHPRTSHGVCLCCENHKPI